MAMSHPASDPTSMRIEAVAQRTGLTKRTIRYYEEIGLVTPGGRSEGGYRLFSEADVARLEHIAALRDHAGLSLAEIAEWLEAEAVRGGIREHFAATDDPAAKRAMLAESRAVLARQMGLIERKRRALDELSAGLQATLRRVSDLDAELAAEKPSR